MMETVKNEELSKINNRLLSAVSHELRTPIAIIKGYATMLLDYYTNLSVAETREYIRSIDNAADRLNKSVDNLLYASYLETGLLKLEIAPVNIADLIEAAVKAAATRDEPVEVVIERGSNLTRVLADQKRIRQVLDNLIDNAIRRSPRGAKIFVAADNNGKELNVSVTDQGPVIPAGELNSIFDLVYSIERKTSANAGDMGLELYICRRLIEAHGGSIRAISAAGKGNAIQFSFPATSVKSIKKR